MTVERPTDANATSVERLSHGRTVVGSTRGRAHDDHRSARWAMLVAALAMVASIGGPLVGFGVFHGADMVLDYAPWAYDAPPEFEPRNPPVGDTVNAAMPMRAEIRRRLLNGDLPLWSRLPAGGTPLAAVPDFSAFSPLLLPYILLPLWYAPAVSKLAELAVAATFTFLFARRLRLGRVAAVTAGLVYTFSGFQVVWTNWPQTSVGAFIPMLFWAVERALAERDLGSAVPVALAVALMLAGGFPAVTGFALLAAGVYALVRAAATQDQPLRGRILRLATLAVMVGLGVALMAVQLLPFLDHLGRLGLAHRLEGPNHHLPLSGLATLVFPFAFGPSSFGPYWGPKNIVELNTFVGVVAVVLVAAAAAHREPRLPPGARGALWGLSGVSLVLIFGGGLPLLAMQKVLPFLFGTNAVGRMRSVVGLLLATLAAVGFDALLRRGGGPLRRRELVVLGSLGVSLLTVAGAALTVTFASPQIVDAFPRLVTLRPLVWPAVVLAAAALAAMAWGLRRWRHLRRVLGLISGASVIGLTVLATGTEGEYVTVVARMVLVPVTVALVLGVVLWGYRLTGDRRLLAAVLPVLVAVEAVGFAHPYWAQSNREHFYPHTETHAFLQDNLDDSRVALADRTLQPGTTTYYDIPSLTAHVFYPPRWGDLIDAVDPEAFGKPTFPKLHVLREDLDRVPTHPILDRLATRYFVASDTLPVIGERHDPPEAPDTVTLRPDIPVTGSLPTGHLRGVRVAVVAPGYDGPEDAAAWLHVDVLDGDRVVTTAARRVETYRQRMHLTVPLPQVDHDGATIVRLRLEGPSNAKLPLRSDGNAPALGYVAPLDDGVRPVWVRGVVVYEQDGWLPRVRWASTTEVIEDADARIQRLSSDQLPDDTVVLDTPGPPADAAPANLKVLEDGGDRIVVRVEAAGDGYLVVADGLQFGWEAEVDGVPTELRAADHALGAVAVPAGEHTVVLQFAPRSHRIGAVTSLAAATILLVAFVATRRRRHPRRQLGNE